MNTAQSWWRRMADRRRAKHESPFAPGELAQYRRKVWRLIRAAKS